jgi:hypothetical protein
MLGHRIGKREELRHRASLAIAAQARKRIATLVEKTRQTHDIGNNS